MRDGDAADPAVDREPLSEQGLRWPAEWEPHVATWLAWPHNPETWPARLPQAEQAFAVMVAALLPGERVEINVADAAMEQRAREALAKVGVGEHPDLRFHAIASDDAWIRDHGPIFLQDPAGGDAVVADFEFDAWGRKYPPWNLDRRVPGEIAGRLERRRIRPGFVLEGGSIDGDGEGTILTTEECLLHANRGGLAPGDRGPRTREGVEAALRRWLGARAVIWLGRGIAGDDTDGHIDDLTRFVAPGRVVTVMPASAGDLDAEALVENRSRLEAARDARGRALEVVALPAPAPVVYDGVRCPASYANFYLANGVALVPVFEDPADEIALATLQDCLPGRRIVPIPARTLVIGLGAVHCLTQQEPVSDPRSAVSAAD